MLERQVERINEGLLALLGSEELVKRWWDSPNYAFGLRTPNEVWNESIDSHKQVINYVLDALNKP